MHIRWNLIAKYISHECTEEENRLIEARIQTDPVFAELIKTLQTSTHLNELPSRPIEVDALWQEFQRRTDAETKEATIRELVSSKPATLPRRSWRMHPIYRIAAMLLITISLAYLFSKGINYSSNQSMTAQQYETVNVQNGQRLNVSLADGSQVTVDAGSELRYFTSYKDERHVYLKGEACFSVAHDSERPFFVHAGNAVVRVVGTRFNVRSWDINPDVVVTVAKGKVLVSHDDSLKSASKMLTHGEQITVTAQGELSETVKVDAEKYFTWMQNEIFFENAKVSEVVAQLERWYDYHFTFKNPKALDQSISVHIRGANVDEVIRVISIVTESQVTRNGKQIVFSPNKSL